MSLPKYKEISSLSAQEIEEEICKLQKNLFELRIKQRKERISNQKQSPHFFRHAKHRVAQLKFRYLLILKEKL